MALPAYISITGKKQGLITRDALTKESVGSAYQSDHKDEAIVQAFSHQIVKPYDPQTGMPTGMRTHQSVIVTKVFDRASPLLQQALCTGEVIESVVINWYRTTNGVQELYYTTTLENAEIVHIKDYMHNCQDTANAHFTHLEDVHFNYRKITWTHNVSTTTASDDWDTQNAV